jgi:uncharacterized protein YjbI with pentapeptide repeats
MWRGRLVLLPDARADLRGASSVRTTICGADLTGLRVSGINAWDVKLDDDTLQGSLVVSAAGSEVRVNDLMVAQFVNFVLQ